MKKMLRTPAHTEVVGSVQNDKWLPFFNTLGFFFRARQRFCIPFSQIQVFVQLCEKGDMEKLWKERVLEYYVVEFHSPRSLLWYLRLHPN